MMSRTFNAQVYRDESGWLVTVSGISGVVRISYPDEAEWRARGMIATQVGLSADEVDVDVWVDPI